MNAIQTAIVLIFADKYVAGCKVDSLLFATEYGRTNKVKKLLAKWVDIDSWKKYSKRRTGSGSQSKDREQSQQNIWSFKR